MPLGTDCNSLLTFKLENDENIAEYLATAKSKLFEKFIVIKNKNDYLIFIIIIFYFIFFADSKKNFFLVLYVFKV